MYNKKAVGPIVETLNWQNGSLAQLGEHLPYKQRVIGSSPIGPIIFLNYIWADSRVAKGDRL